MVSLQPFASVVINIKSCEALDESGSKGSLKEVVENIKETKANKIASAIKKRYNDIAIVNAFNKNRKKITIKNMTEQKLKRILRKLNNTLTTMISYLISILKN